MSRINESYQWKSVNLGQICSQRAETINPKITPDAPYVGLEHIDSGSPFLKRCGKASEVSSSKSKFYAGDTLYGKLRPYLDKAVIAEFEGVCSTDILVFRPKDNLEPSFLSNLAHTQAFIEHAVKTTRGVNHPRTSWAALSEFGFCLPPLPEQRAIARALRAVQEAREARRKELQLERERKAAIMQYLFTHGTRGESRKQTEIGEMPESWQVMRLREVVTVKGGKRLPKGSDFAQGRTPYPYIRIVDFKEGSVKTADLKYLTADVQKQISRYTISARDVYISIAGTIGLVGVVPEMLEGANLTENAAKLVIQKYDLLDKGFLARYLSGEAGQAQIESLTAKTTQPKLALTRIEQIVIPIPSITEQVEIADIVQACEIKINALQQESLLLDELFRALLEELMTGRLSTLPLIED